MIDLIEKWTQQIKTLKYNKWKIHKNKWKVLFQHKQYYVVVLLRLLIMSNKPIYRAIKAEDLLGKKNWIFQGLQNTTVFFTSKEPSAY